MQSVAPALRARSNFSGWMSTRKIRRAPAMRAPWTAERPTPPPPTTATVEPGATRADLSTEPRPVQTPQPMTAARSIG